MKKDPDMIFERVFVETPVDTDGDGKLDLIAVYIRRPAYTDAGEKVPAIFVANPYMMTCNEDWYVPHDVNKEVKVYPQQNISEEEIRYDFTKEIKAEPREPRETKGFARRADLTEEVEFEAINPVYEYFNEKGYASVFSAGLGTKGSEGFTLTGSREEIMAFKAVIDWLCGRCRAFTNLTDNIEIRADWCTGSVAMSAKSYLGTMCIGVAATGVEGLKTIIPEAGISNWYNYYRCNGLVLPALEWQGDDLDILAKYCFSRAKDSEDYAGIKDAYAEALAGLEAGEDRDSGNYNRFWDERNYMNLIDRIKASVFIIHGINDWNVKTNQCLPLFEELEKRDIPRKIMLHQGEHIYIYHLKDSHNLEIMERWLDHYLKGVDNGIEKEPKVLVESNIDQSCWMESDTWPPAGWNYETFPVEAEGPVTLVDDLAATVYDREKDNQKAWRDELILSESTEYRNRVKYIWEPFRGEDTLRVSGTVQVAFDAAVNRETAILSAMLVDLGEDCRITSEEVDLGDGSFAFGLEQEPSQYKVISRGWLNAQNRNSIWSKDTVKPGESYHYAFDMVPTDHTLKKGHRLGLILYGIDAEETLRPDTVTEITIDQASVQVKVPLIR